MKDHPLSGRALVEVWVWGVYGICGLVRQQLRQRALQAARVRVYLLRVAGLRALAFAAARKREKVHGSN